MRRQLAYPAVIPALAMLAAAPGAAAGSAATAQPALKVIDLGALGNDLSSEAVAINNNGSVAGNSNGQAFLWRTGRMTILGSLGAGSFAADVNNHDDVVGYSDTGDRSWHAFRWRNGRMTDQGTLDGDYGIAYDINNLGQVVGDSTIDG